MTVGEALAAPGLDPREARILLAAACEAPLASLLAHAERELAPEPARRFADWAQRRRSGEPVAYLLGRREFHDLDLDVGPAVLIPRPETELLVERALVEIAGRHAPRVADLGTGSGAVALAIQRQRPDACIVAVDASAAALEVARANAQRLGLPVELRRGAWFAPLRGERFDLIVSNPPYVAEGDPHLGQGDLRFEPRAALVAGPDGLAALREIIRGAPAHLAPHGGLLVEHGIGQVSAVRELLAAAGFVGLESHADLAGIARVSGGRLR